MTSVLGEPSLTQILQLMQAYNENIGSFIQYLNSIRRQRQSRYVRSLFEDMPTVREPRQQQTPLGQERQQNPIRNDTATPMTTVSINYDFPVTRPTRLTHQQISNATTMYCVTQHQLEEMENTTCAISHQEYHVGDILCRINVCRHEFLYRELMHWFDINSTCPICRGNVVSTPPVANIQEVPQGVATQTEQTESERVDAITQLLRSFMTPTTGEGESQLRLFQDDFDISFVSVLFPSNRDRAV